MKKILLGVAAVAAVAAASCSKTADNTAAKADTFTVSAAVSDSINTYFGQYVGSSILGEYTRLDSAMKAEQPKADILKGVQLAMGAPDQPGVAVGMQIGMQIINNIRQMKDNGINVERNAVLASFKKAFQADSIDPDAARAAQMVYQEMMNRIQLEKKAFDDSIKANAPEALENVAAAEKYITAAKAQDPEIKTTESGLSYKIENAGDDTKITRRDLAQVKYTGRLIDGTVFDSNDNARFSPAGVVAGFGEGLQMLGKGGKATFYIPGNLAYGVEGAPRAGIGPNAMLIFDVEILDVNPGR